MGCGCSPCGPVKNVKYECAVNPCCCPVKEIEENLAVPECCGKPMKKKR